MQYIIAVAHDNHIYWMHGKIYFNEKKALNALEVMQANKKISSDAKVYQVTTWPLQEIKKQSAATDY